MSRGIHRNNNQQWIMVKRVHHFLLYIALFLLLVIFRGMWRAVTVLDRHLQAEDYHQLTTMMTTLLSDKKASLRLQSREQRQHQNIVVAVEQNRDRMVQSDIVEIVSSDANNISQTVPSQTTTKTLSVELSPTPPLNTDDSSRRFLVFHGKHRGQGSGNIMQGLLSAHLFGLEFNRTVCVLWPAFFTAFEYSQPQHKDLCQGAESWHATPILMWNFAKAPVDECHVHDILSDPKINVVSYSGNAYPGWRSDIPSGLFYQYFQPKTTLLSFLPYSKDNAPKVVVHLRAPDGKADSERGLDEESLSYLGEMLRGNGTYLVTNRPDWYRRFHECCGWSYDTTWVDKPIDHGAMSISWQPDGTRVLKKYKDSKMLVNQQLKMWSDWYTMLNAEKVYHSPSDFSRSAIHWNSDCMGYGLSGMRTVNKTIRELLLRPSYDSTKYIPPLVERQEPDSLRDDDDCVFLRFCRKYDSAKIRQGRFKKQKNNFSTV